MKYAFFAGLFHVVFPGFGQFYCGRWGRGLWMIVVFIMLASPALVSQSFIMTIAAAAFWFWVLADALYAVDVANGKPRKGFANE